MRTLRVAVPLLIALALVTPALITSLALNFEQLTLLRSWSPRTFAQIPQCPAPPASPYDVSALNMWLQRQPAYQRIWLLQGRFEWLNGDCESAAASWQQAALLTRDDTVAQLLSSLARYAAGDSTSWDASLAPAQAQAYAVRMGKLSQDNQDHDGAIRWYERAHSALPRRLTAELLADLYQRAGQPGLARQAWERLAAALTTSDTLHWWSLGKAEEMTGNWQSAAAAYAQGLDVTEDKYELLMQLGYVQEHLDPAQSAVFYRQAMNERPESIWPRLGLGHIAMNRGKFAEAQDWYTQALDIAPNDVNPHYYLGVLAFTQDDCTSTATHLKDALTRLPDHSPSLFLLAQCSHRAGNLERARSLLAAAIQSHSGPSAAWAIELGDWYLESNLATEARAQYEQALAMEPDNADARARLTALQAQD